MRFIRLALFAVLAAGPVLADGFDKVDDREAFVSLVEDKSLKRFGIDLTVKPSGEIAGRAFGRNVSGAWKWKSGYFCRDLYWGKKDLGPNCQAVKVQGETIRFISDHGTGQFADLVLE